MADIAISAGVYPTVARVGGDNYGAHTEPNLTGALGALSSGNMIASGLNVVGHRSPLTITAGTAIISGYYVSLNQPVNITVANEVPMYVYLKLKRTTAGLVDGVLLEANTTGVQPADSLPLVVATWHAVYDTMDKVPLSPRGVLFGDIGGVLYAGTDRVYTLGTAPPIAWVKPSDTILWELDDGVDRLMGNDVYQILAVRAGRYRFKFLTKGSLTNNQTVTVTDGAGAVLGTAGNISPGENSLDLTFVPAGTILHVNAIPGTDYITHPRLCGDDDYAPQFQLVGY